FISSSNTGFNSTKFASSAAKQALANVCTKLPPLLLALSHQRRSASVICQPPESWERGRRGPLSLLGQLRPAPRQFCKQPRACEALPERKSQFLGLHCGCAPRLRRSKSPPAPPSTPGSRGEGAGRLR